MNLHTSPKFLGRRLTLLSAAAILINANTVLAADHVADAQMQARDLLSGTGGATKTLGKSLAVSADHHRKSYSDSQEQARQFILGNPSFNGAASREFAVQAKTNVLVPVPTRRNSRVYTDPQELARRVILGKGSGRESTDMRLSGIAEVKK